MNYRNPQIIEQLAAEYVLGTLQGAARRRFERLMMDREDIRQAVWSWESRLGRLSAEVAPVPPPASAWRTIEQRISDEPARPARALTFWRLWSTAVTLAAVVLLTVVFTSDAPDTGLNADHVAIVGDSSEPLWVISANLQTGELSARAVNATAAELDRVFELWMLPESGAPQSIGLLPVNGNQVSHRLSPALRALLSAGGGLAISIEPPGGSPTGLPTGPVVHTAEVVSL